MATRETQAAIGAHRAQYLSRRLGEQLGTARRGAGLSLREVGRRFGSRHQVLSQVERGDLTSMRVGLLARYAAVLGLELAASLHPNGDPVRDRGHLALLARFRARLAPTVRWRTEVPVPIAGDPRSGDGVISGSTWEALVEAETRLHDIQHVERRARAKQRDLGARRLILVVAATRHNRAVLRLHPELHERFPIGTRACLVALAAGKDPGGDGLVVL